MLFLFFSDFLCWELPYTFFFLLAAVGVLLDLLSFCLPSTRDPRPVSLTFLLPSLRFPPCLIDLWRGTPINKARFNFCVFSNWFVLDLLTPCFISGLMSTKNMTE
jgi:hypothetical protein